MFQKYHEVLLTVHSGLVTYTSKDVHSGLVTYTSKDGRDISCIKEVTPCKHPLSRSSGDAVATGAARGVSGSAIIRMLLVVLQRIYLLHVSF